MTFILSACGGGSGNSSSSGASSGGSSVRRSFADIPAMIRANRPATVQIVTDKGVGSGVFIRGDGYIATNYHVVVDANDLLVGVFEDPSSVKPTLVLQGFVVGMIPAADTAVVKIPALKDQSYPTIPWGDSDQLSAGQTVLAIGAPYELSQTVTQGIVSATNRPMKIVDGSTTDLIQVDAPIHPGNSGGPLLNTAGDLVGINTEIVTPNLAFSVPSSLASAACRVIIANFELHPAFGAQLTENENGIVQVSEVNRGTVAEKIDLQPGDVFVSYDKTPAHSSEDLILMVRTSSLTETHTIVVKRGKHKIKKKFTWASTF